MFVDSVCRGQSRWGQASRFPDSQSVFGLWSAAAGHLLGRERERERQKKKEVTQTTSRFTVDQGEINTTKKILMVWTVLAQFEYSQQCNRHAKYLNNRVKPNAEQLFRCGAEVEKHKPLSLVWVGFPIWGQLTGHVGLPSWSNQHVKCFWEVSYRLTQHAGVFHAFM